MWTKTVTELCVVACAVIVWILVACGPRPLTDQQKCHERGFKYTWAKHQSFCLERRPDGMYNALVLPEDAQ